MGQTVTKPVTSTADVPGLDTALAGKAATSHAHSGADITTGTVAAARLPTGTGAGQIPILDGGGKLSTAVLPGLALTTVSIVTSQAAMLAITAEPGDVAIRTDLSESFILSASPASTLGNWQKFLTPTDVVTSVAGRTGAVTLTTADIGGLSTSYLSLAGGTLTGSLVFGYANPVITTESNNGRGNLTISTGTEDAGPGGSINFISGLGTPGGRGSINFTAATFNFSGGSISGNAAGLTNIAAGSIATGTVPTARLGSGTANAIAVLRGNQTWGPDIAGLSGINTIRPTSPSRYYATGYRTAGGITLTFDAVCGMLIYVSADFTATRIGTTVNTPVASNTVRLGIYTPGADGLPSARVLDAGTVDGSTSGDKEITISQALTAGWYWIIAVQASGAGVQLQRTLSPMPVPMVIGTLVSNNDQISAFVTTTTSSSWRTALPSTCSAGDVSLTGFHAWIR